MSDGHDCDMMCERLELYALDGMEEHEKIAFDYHLTQCALCRNRLVELKQVVELLPVACRPVPLPKGMRERVLGAVMGKAAGQAGMSTGSRETDPTGGTDSAYPGRVAVHGRKPVQSIKAGDEERDAAELSRRIGQAERVSRRVVYWRLVSAVFGAAVIATGMYAYQLNNTVSSLKAELAASAAELVKAGSELDQAKADLVSMNNPAEALKVNRIVNLTPAAENTVSKGLASIATDAKGTHLIVQAEDLPPTKQEEAFQVWLIKDNQPMNAGSFYPLNGKGVLYFTFEPKDYDTLAVTLEPDARGDKPRGAVVLSASLKG